jgi:D-lactate dehydrogenase
MKVAFFEVQDWDRPMLSEWAGAARDAVIREDCVTTDNAAEFHDCDVVSVFLYCAISDEIMAAMPQLRLVATRSTGVDHIDLKAAQARGVAVAHVPQYGANTVAEHTFGLILGLSRKVYAADRRVRQKNFALEGLVGFDLRDKTLGVVGAGNIGLHVIRIARSLSMRVLAYDVHRNDLLAEVLGFEYASLERVLRESEVVSLHAPLIEATRHLINAETLSQMKPGALLINTARGGLVDTAALANALESGHLGGAALDVFEGEEAILEESELLYGCREKCGPVEVVSRLLDRDDVIVTPHMAFYSREALERILRTTLDNIEAFAAGRPQNLVTGARP